MTDLDYPELAPARRRQQDDSLAAGAISQGTPGTSGAYRVPGGGAYNPAVANSAQAVQSYRQNFGHNWLKANPGGNPGDFEAALAADPQFQALNKTHGDAQQAHVEGYSQPDYQARQKAIDYLDASGKAVTQDASSRDTQANGQFNRDTGQGAMYRGQGRAFDAQANETTMLAPARRDSLNAGTNRTNALTPVEVAQGNANVGLTNASTYNVQQLTPVQVAQGNAAAQQATANANRTTAMTPAEVAQGTATAGKTNAETGAINTNTKLLPDIVKNQQAIAAQDRALNQRKTESEIVKNVRDPITGQLPAGYEAPTPAGSGTEPAAASPPATPAPADRGLVTKAIDALWSGAQAASPILGGSKTNLLGPTVMGINGARGLYEGWNGPTPPPTPAAATVAPGTPQRRMLPDGRMIEISNGQTFQIMPDGSKRPLRVTQ